MPEHTITRVSNELCPRHVTRIIGVVNCCPSSLLKGGCVMKLFPAWSRWADELWVFSPELVDTPVAASPVHETTAIVFAVCQQ